VACGGEEWYILAAVPDPATEGLDLNADSLVELTAESATDGLRRCDDDSGVSNLLVPAVAVCNLGNREE
jgi:hypothetical protein